VSQITRISKAHGDSIWCVVWAGNGSDNENEFVTGSVDGTVKIWTIAALGNPEKEKVSCTETFSEQSMGIISVATSDKSPYLVTSSMDSHLRIWDLQKREFIKSIDCGAIECWTLAFHPSGEKVATGTHTGAVNVWSVEEKSAGELITTLETKGGFALSLAYNSTGTMLAVGDKDGNVYIFEHERLVHTLQAHAMAIRSLCFSVDDSMLLTASDDTTVNIYDAQSKDQIGTVKGHSSWVMSVACSPDGKYFATASSDKRVRIWDLKQRSCLQTFESHTDQVFMVAFNRQGNRLVSVGGEGDIQLYSVT